jgi:hypothetical protein
MGADAAGLIPSGSSRHRSRARPTGSSTGNREQGSRGARGSNFDWAPWLQEIAHGEARRLGLGLGRAEESAEGASGREPDWWSRVSVACDGEWSWDGQPDGEDAQRGTTGLEQVARHGWSLQGIRPGWASSGELQIAGGASREMSTCHGKGLWQVV